MCRHKHANITYEQLRKRAHRLALMSSNNCSALNEEKGPLTGGVVVSLLSLHLCSFDNYDEVRSDRNVCVKMRANSYLLSKFIVVICRLQPHERKINWISARCS